MTTQRQGLANPCDHDAANARIHRAWPIVSDLVRDRIGLDPRTQARLHVADGDDEYFHIWGQHGLDRPNDEIYGGSVACHLRPNLILFNSHRLLRSDRERTPDQDIEAILAHEFWHLAEYRFGLSGVTAAPAVRNMMQGLPDRWYQVTGIIRDKWPGRSHYTPGLRQRIIDHYCYRSHETRALLFEAALCHDRFPMNEMAATLAPIARDILGWD